jgi:hypothetical protein
MILSVEEPIKLVDTPKEQKRKGGERLRTKFNRRRQRKGPSEPFATKGRQYCVVA